MTQILILNAGISNKGTLALIYSTVDTVREFLPDSQFTFMGIETDRKDIHIKQQLALRPLKNFSPWLYLIQCSVIDICRYFGICAPVSKNSRLYDYYASDIVINSGGDHLSGEKFGFTSFLNILYAVLLNKPVVLYGESLGYFQHPVFEFIGKAILNKTDLILVRDSISKKYLDNAGIRNPRVYLTADSAFLLNPVSHSDALNILSEEGISNVQKPLVGINASGLISKFRKVQSQNIENDIILIFSEAIDHLVEVMDATVILVPHVYTQAVDDRKVIDLIYQNVKNKSKVYTIKNEYNPKELKGIIGLCDLFIGARMHSTIASTSMLVPTVGIAYSHKMYGIIGDMLGLEDYIIDINDLNSDILISKIEQSWENRDKIVNELTIRIPEVKQRAMLNGKFVKELLDSYGS